MKILKIAVTLVLMQAYLIGMHKPENLQPAGTETKKILSIKNVSKERVTVTFVKEIPPLVQTYRMAPPIVQEEILGNIQPGKAMTEKKDLTLPSGDKGELVVLYGSEASPHETVFGPAPLARQARMNWDQLEKEAKLIINNQGIVPARAKLS